MKVNPLPSPRAREAIEHRVSGLTRAATSAVMGISERRVSQLTAGQDIAALRRKRWADERTAASLQARFAALQRAGIAPGQDLPAPVSEPKSAPPEPAPVAPVEPVEHEAPASHDRTPGQSTAPPEVYAGHDSGPRREPPTEPCPIDGCDRTFPLGNSAAIERHLEVAHSDEPAPAPRGRDRKLKPGQAWVETPDGFEIVFCLPLGGGKDGKGYSPFAEAIGRGQTLDGNGSGGGIANGQPKTAREVLVMLRENGFLSPDPDKPMSFTRKAHGPEGHRRYVCVRVGYARGKFWPGEGPDSVTELGLLIRCLAKDLAAARRGDGSLHLPHGFKVSERDLVPA
jgi:hypothetical protein